MELESITKNFNIEDTGKFDVDTKIKVLAGGVKIKT